MVGSGFYSLAASLIVGTLVGLVILSRWTSRRLAAITLATVWIAMFASAWTLAAIDWNDADGFIDCYGYCSATHVGVGTVLVTAPLIVATLLVVAALPRRRVRGQRVARTALRRH